MANAPISAFFLSVQDLLTFLSPLRQILQVLGLCFQECMRPLPRRASEPGWPETVEHEGEKHTSRRQRENSFGSRASDVDDLAAWKKVLGKVLVDWLRAHGVEDEIEAVGGGEGVK